METFEIMLGLAMFYSWIHFVVIAFRKLHKLTSYERVVCWVAFLSMFFYVIGTLY
jgi:hypothetical protein